MDTDDVSFPNDFNTKYAAKINEAWSEVLASGERRVGGLVTTGALLNQWKAAVKASEKKWMDEAAALLPFGLDKAERLMAIAAIPLLADSANWRILPPHLSTLHALAKMPPGLLERAFAEKLIHDDLSVRRIEEIVEMLEPARYYWNNGPRRQRRADATLSPAPAEQAAADSPSPTPTVWEEAVETDDLTGTEALIKMLEDAIRHRVKGYLSRGGDRQGADQILRSKFGEAGARIADEVTVDNTVVDVDDDGESDGEEDAA
jgi:hypothetical protein